MTPRRGTPEMLSALVTGFPHVHRYNSQDTVAVHGTPPRGSSFGLGHACDPLAQLGTQRTWSNVRLVLGEEARERMSIPPRTHDPEEPSYVIGRLYFTSSTHYSIRNATLDKMTLVHASLPSLAIQNLMNNKGPDALISSIPNESVHSELLMDMLLVCHRQQLCLVSKTRDNVDIVLVPRVPTVASRDSIFWLVYATNLCAVNLCERLRKEKRVAVVLDLDQTLVDAEVCAWDGHHVDDFDDIEWEDVDVRSWDGEIVHGKRGRLIAGDAADRQDVFFVHYARYLFRVRIRGGWWELREFLVENRDKYMTFVCSKGKREYVELIYGGLDAEARLIPREKWEQRITSTWPDSLALAADKNALMALGCADPGDWMAAVTHVAAPVICVDDCPQTYTELFRPNVLLVEKFSNGVSAGGFAMLRVIEDLNTFWEGVCGKEGTFAWRAAQSFGMAIMDAMRSTAMESPDALQYLQSRCRKQGELLYRQLTVEYVLPGSTPAGNGTAGGRRTRHAPNSSGDIGPVARRKSLEMNNADVPGSRRSLDEALFLASEGSAPSMPLSIPKLARHGSSLRNNDGGMSSLSSTGASPRGLSPSGLSPGSIDDDLVTFSLRFKN